MSNTGPAVDIGMPAYKRPQFVAQAIESVLAQTHTNWRLTVSENGPGGGEVEAAVRPFLTDPRVNYVATGENLGATANWTRLLQTGDAPYFTLIQDDDKWDPEFLAHRVEFLEANPEAGFVFSGERKMDQEGREIDIERVPSLPVKDVADVLPQGVYAPRDFVTTMYRLKLGGIHTPAICSLGVMSRRTALKAIGYAFDPEYPFLFWDVQLYMRMALRFPTGFLALRDGTQRLHHPSLTSEANFDGEHWIFYHSFHGEWFRRALPGLKLPREYHQIFAEAYIMAALDALERGDRRKVAKYVRGALRQDPAAIVNPRIVAATLGMLLGRRGADALTRIRAARRRRSEQLAYEADGQTA